MLFCCNNAENIYSNSPLKGRRRLKEFTSSYITEYPETALRKCKPLFNFYNLFGIQLSKSLNSQHAPANRNENHSGRPAISSLADPVIKPTIKLVNV